MARKPRTTTDSASADPACGSGTRKAAKESPPSRITKRARLTGMLATSEGASIAEIGSALAWQPHTVRAALSALRKAGARIERIAPATDGDAARYLLVPAAEGGA